MSHPLAPTANATPRHARVLLATFVLTTAFLVAITFSPLASGFADAPRRGAGDIALYQAEAQRVRAGENYYDAAAAELTARGYPTASVFNWRTPLTPWLVGKLPEPAMANVLLTLVALALVLGTFQLLGDEAGVNQAIVGVLLLVGALLPCFLGELVLAPELWSGVLIALSAVAFGVRRPAVGVASGIAALFFRELAAPYCLVCVLSALGARRYRELTGWAAGLAAYAVFYGLHLAEVLPRITPAATAHAEGWVRFGAAGFVISTTQMNAFLLLLPQWVTAVYLACALLGAATWNTPAGRRIAYTVVVYVVGFAMIGHDFNQYWGSQTAPLLCLPVARSWWALAALWRASNFSLPKRRGTEASAA